MALPTSLTIALKALRRNKLQTGLTMLGMTIGVATVLTMIALGSGAQKAIQDQVKAAGMNMLIVKAGNFEPPKPPVDDAIEMGAMSAPDIFGPRSDNPEVNMHPHLVRSAFHEEDDPFAVHDHPLAKQRLGDSEAGLGSASTLTMDDAKAIRQIKGVQFACEGIQTNVHVVLGGTREFTVLHASGTSLPNIRRAWTFTQGGYFTQSQQDKKEQVIVLGTIVAQSLFGAKNPVGETVTLWNQPFKVIGVVSSSSWLTTPTAGDEQFDAVYIPVTTLQRLWNLGKLNDITVTTESTGDVTRVSKIITTLLRQRHKIGENSPDDFTVASQATQALKHGGLRQDVASAVTGNVSGLEQVTLSQLGKTLDKSSETMTALLASIATVSLIVGGIGIMNIMLLSVTERTREIGIRRAVGARSKEVLMQFLFESVTLSLVGGLIGVGIGVVAAIMISRTVQWSTSISPLSVALSFGVSAAVGIFFGYYPAREASRVAPLSSLRYE
jgi:putative ABC transport system permease protein